MSSPDPPSQGTRVSRSTLFAGDLVPAAPCTDPSVLASLDEQFPFDITNTLPPQPTTMNSSRQITQGNGTTEFKLFSMAGPAKVDLSAPVYEVPLINRTRPKEYYFTSPDDTERISQLNAIVVSGLQIIQDSQKPYAAKRNPKLAIVIPMKERKPKKRRKPSKKERDYRKKVKAEEEKRQRNERKYEKFLKYGAGTTAGARKRGRGGSRGRGRGMG